MDYMLKKLHLMNIEHCLKTMMGLFWLSGLAWHVKPFADCFGIFFKNIVSFQFKFCSDNIQKAI